MPTVRNAIEAFVSGTLDYGALQAELEAEAGGGMPRDVALHELRVVSEEIGLSPALNNLIARAIDRHFGGQPGGTSGTVPGGFGDQTSPGQPEVKAKVARPPAPPEDEEADGEHTEETLGMGAPPAEGDPVEGLGPIYAAGVEDEPAPALPDVAPAGPALPEPGAVLADRYVLQSVLGRGGMGVVYRALDRRREEARAGNPFVALKVLRRELQSRPAARQRLFAEALRGQALNHPNVVAVHDFDRDGELAFVTMELLEGERLRTLIVRSAPDGLPQHEAFAILRGLLEAVAHLHALGVVHRDLTPGNVLITHDGAPKLLDFGLTQGAARRDEPALRPGEDHAGHTPAYASPEVLDGKPPDPRDDVYALGVLAYELLTSRHPFGKLAADEAHRKKLRPRSPPGLSHAQWHTLRSALSFEAARRPVDARALLQGMALTPRKRTLRPGVVQGLLAGTAAGVLLTLAVIHPDGPIGRRLDDVPVAATPIEAPAVDAAPTPAEPEVEPVPTQEPEPAATAARPPPAAEPAGDDVLTPLAPPPALERAPDPTPVAATPPAVPATVAAPAPAPGRLGFTSAAFHISEDSAVLMADVVRSDGADGRVAVYWRTVASNALDGDDYIGNGWQRLELQDQETRAQIFIPLVDDGLAEVPESFYIELDRPDGGASIGPIVRAEVRIVDDDRPPGG